jgi:hypothetical protein
MKELDNKNKFNNFTIKPVSIKELAKDNFIEEDTDIINVINDNRIDKSDKDNVDLLKKSTKEN